MSRIDTQAKLFQITHTTGMSYSTAVHSTCGTMVKQPSPAIATHRPVGRGELGAERAGGAEAHAGEAPGVEHRLRTARLPELHVPVVIDADVAAEDRVVRQHRLAVRDHPLGPDRRGVDLEIRPGEGFPFALPALDLGMPGLQRTSARGLRSFQLGQKLAQEGARVGENADVRRIVAAKLRRIDIDMDELGVREIPRIARHPGRGRAVVEARADRDHQVGMAAGLVRRDMRRCGR